MTLEEMQKAKALTEQAIREALNAFMRDTGLRVCDVRMELIDVTRIGLPPEYMAGEVRLATSGCRSNTKQRWKADTCWQTRTTDPGWTSNTSPRRTRATSRSTRTTGARRIT